MLDARIVVPAALALTRLRSYAESVTACAQRHLTAFQVLHGVTFPSTATVQLTLRSQQSTPDTCRVGLYHNQRACYRALAMHNTTPPLPSSRLPPQLHLHDSDLSTVYREILFHGPRWQLLTAISAPHAQTSSAAFVIPATLERETAMIDAALQLAIVHIHRRYRKTFSLPAAIGSYRLFNPAPPSQGTLTVRVTARHNAHVLLDADITHHTRLLARLDAIEMIQGRRRGVSPTVQEQCATTTPK